MIFAPTKICPLMLLTNLRICFLLSLFISIASIDLNARSRLVEVTASQQEAEIFANGKLVGKGYAKVIVIKNIDVLVEVKLAGFLTEKRTFYYRSGMPAEKSFYFDLKPDDALEASTLTEVSNQDIGINTSKKREEAWELLTHIVLLYFEIPEQMDEKAGYLRTAWQTEIFAQSTVRTRLIVRTFSLNPLSYRVKIVSEIAEKSNVSGSDDNKFKPWDRILRKYEQLIPELQSRLK